MYVNLKQKDMKNLLFFLIVVFVLTSCNTTKALSKRDKENFVWFTPYKKSKKKEIKSSIYFVKDPPFYNRSLATSTEDLEMMSYIRCQKWKINFFEKWCFPELKDKKETNMPFYKPIKKK